MEKDLETKAPETVSGIISTLTRRSRRKEPRSSKEHVTTSIRRPNAKSWFRTRDDWTADVYIYEDDDRKTYVLAPDVAAEIGDELVIEATLHGAVTLRGDFLLIPAKISDHEASVSLAEALEVARDEWVRVHWSATAGQYQYATPKDADEIGAPVWPEGSWESLFAKATKGVIIDSLDHEVIQRVLHARI